MLKKIYFMGILANVDESIMKMELGQGFKINSCYFNEIVDFITKMSFSPPSDSFDIATCCYSNDIYYINYYFEGDIDIENYKGHTILRKYPREELDKFEKDYINNYFANFFRIMRLFKEGNICMPLWYIYFIDDNNSPQMLMVLGKHPYIERELFTLKDSEVPDLQKFIHEIKLPFNRNFIKLSYEFFELSYEIEDMNLSFLSLMSSLDALLKPSGEELTYRTSRNIAMLLGNNLEDTKNIYQEFKNNMYKKKSTIGHGENLKIIKKDDILKLRYHIRESIKKINNMDKSKKELLDLLHLSGYATL